MADVKKNSAANPDCDCGLSYIGREECVKAPGVGNDTAFVQGLRGKRGPQGPAGPKGDTGAQGPKGAAGADAVVVSVTSSNGFFFKNTSVATTLVAHVYRAGVELTPTQTAALGTIKWYKDGSTTATATGATLTIDAGDVTNLASYVAQLEG